MVAYDISDETESYNRERSLSVDYFSNPEGMAMTDDNVRTFGKTMVPVAYQNLPSGPIDINSKEGKALRKRTTEAGKSGQTVSEVYNGWQKDYAKGQKKRK